METDLRRRHPRYRHTTSDGLGLDGAGVQMVGVTSDLSVGGCSLRFESPVQYLLGAAVEVWLKTGSGIFRVPGHVRRWTGFGGGVGIQFTDTGAGGRRRLEGVIEECVRELAEAEMAASAGNGLDAGGGVAG